MTAFASSVRTLHFNHRVKIRQLHTHLAWLCANLEKVLCLLSLLGGCRSQVSPEYQGLFVNPRLALLPWLTSRLRRSSSLGLSRSRRQEHNTTLCTRCFYLKTKALHSAKARADVQSTILHSLGCKTETGR